MSALSDIIERLEKASGPDRRLDTVIAEHLGDWKMVGGFWVEHKISGAREHNPSYPPKRPYTSSIDAALTLVPEGVEAAVSTASEIPGRARATTYGRHLTTGSAATPAIALCIAALKCRAHSTQEASANG